jgi:hypothetical protein
MAKIGRGKIAVFGLSRRGPQVIRHKAIPTRGWAGFAYQGIPGRTRRLT